MSPIVRAYVESYDLVELKEMLRGKLAILEGRKEVTGASSGGGTSYSGEVVMSLKEHIECLQEAIMLKRMDEGEFSEGVRVGDVGVREVRFDHLISKF